MFVGCWSIISFVFFVTKVLYLRYSQGHCEVPKTSNYGRSVTSNVAAGIGDDEVKLNNKSVKHARMSPRRQKL